MFLLAAILLFVTPNAAAFSMLVGNSSTSVSVQPVDRSNIIAIPLLSQAQSQIRSQADYDRQYPPKITASARIVGRLKSLFWGDYFYASFGTKQEKVTFLIDDRADCLLRQKQGKTITIRYDRVERYLPQAGGYYRINQIKTIDGIDLKQWQKSLSRAQQNQCDRAGPASTINFQ